MKNVLFKLLFWLHLFVGIGALFGGMGAILNPQEPMGMSVELLENSPFSSYLIPGLTLFVLIGLGNIIAAFLIRSNHKFQIYISSLLGVILVSWILIQVSILGTFNFLHGFYLFLGLINISSNIFLFKKVFQKNSK